MCLALCGVIGCQTYRTTRVHDDAAARGYPFVFQKPYIAQVTYTDGSRSAHVVQIPTLYAVDVERAAFGLTKASFENTGDGFASKASVDLDQKVPENIKAISDLLTSLGLKLSGAPAAPGAPPVEFQPELTPGKEVKSIEVSPL